MGDGCSSAHIWMPFLPASLEQKRRKKWLAFHYNKTVFSHAVDNIILEVKQSPRIFPITSSYLCQSFKIILVINRDGQKGGGQTVMICDAQRTTNHEAP